MTSNQVESLLEKLTPDIKIALRAILSGKEGPVHAFDVDGTVAGVRQANSHSVVVAILPKTIADGFMVAIAAAIQQQSVQHNRRL